MGYKAEVIRHQLPSGETVVFKTILIQLKDDRTLVVFTTETSSPLGVVIGGTEDRFRQVCQEQAFDPEKVVAVQYDPIRLKTRFNTYGGWEIIDWEGGVGNFAVPRQMTDLDWAWLGIDPPDDPESLQLG